MDTISIFSPNKNTRATISTIRNASEWTQRIVAFTSGVGVYMWANQTAVKYLPNWGVSPYLAIAFAALLAAMAAYLTDIGFGRILQNALFRTFASTHPNVQKWRGHQYFARFQTAETIMQWGLIAILLAMDIATMWVVTDPISALAGSDRTMDIEAQRRAMQSEHTAQVAVLRADLKTRLGNIRESERRVEVSNPALVRLKATGNAWAQKEISRISGQATKQDRKSAAAIEEALQTTITNGQQYISNRVSEMEQKNLEIQERNRKNQGVAAVMYLIFTIGLKILTVFLRVMIVVSFIAYSYNYRPDITGDGQIDYEDVEAFANGSTAPFQQART